MSACWYAVWTKPRQEQRAAQNLANQGFDVYLPRIRERKRLHGRMQWVEAPLFPRYLFVWADCARQSLASIRSTLGCMDLVRVNREPVAVPAPVVEAIQDRLCDGTWMIDDIPRCKPGDPLEVISGPFAGLRVLFQQKTSAGRVRVFMNLLGQRQSAVLPSQVVQGAA